MTRLEALFLFQRRDPAHDPTRIKPLDDAASQRRARSGFDEPVSDRVAGQLDTVVQAELLEDVRAVALDRVLADHQRLCDLTVGVALRDELDDFGLPWRQRVACLLAVARAIAGERVAVIDQRPRTLEDVAALLLGHVGAVSGACHDAANQYGQTPAGVAATTQRDQ